MRLGRWLILAAIFSIIVFVVTAYLKRKEFLAREAPAPPAPLAVGLEGRASDWCYTESQGDQPRVKVCASKMQQIKAPSLMDLEGVQLQIYHKDGAEYDLVKSAKAQFDVASKTLYSEGDVEITMGLPSEGPPQGRLVKILTSGVHFASDTGKAVTDRPATFEFDQGGGSSVGAEYDPTTRELHLKSQVKLDWRGKTPDAVPMHIEAGEAFYRELDSKVVLQPWSKLTRGTLHMDAGAAVVSLDKGEIQRADAQSAHGVQDDPGRRVEFAADQLALHFGDRMQVQQIEGDRNARLVSTSATARTTVTSNHLDLEFAMNGAESTLENATATGNSVAESVPLPRPGTPPADTRILSSDKLLLIMRPGGQEMDHAETEGPGTLDFLPNRPGQPKRAMKGDRIFINYGPGNHIQSVHSINVSTRTERPPSRSDPKPPPVLTRSKDLLAGFDASTSQLTVLKQTTDFQYQEGARRATANSATLEQQTGLMTLDGAARAWDPTGSVTADRIVMNQKTGDYAADGHVASAREPDHQGKSSAMLSTDEVLQARADRMTSAAHNTKIGYDGHAVAWQGANRVEADHLDIDRQRQVLQAHGHVISQFVDNPPRGAAATGSRASQSALQSAPPSNDTPGKGSDQRSSPSSAPVFTVVRAPDLIYNDQTREAFYKGGVSLARPGLTVDSHELRAFLNNSGADSSLNKAFADGAVKIVSTMTNSDGTLRTRTGTGEHAEYYAAEGKVILRGGKPLMVDSLKGKTSGKQLTWWANNDRLLVDGGTGAPAQTTILKK